MLKNVLLYPSSLEFYNVVKVCLQAKNGSTSGEHLG